MHDRGKGTASAPPPASVTRTHETGDKYDPRQLALPSANSRTRRQRGNVRGRGTSHTALDPRRDRGSLSNAARNDPRPGHSGTTTLLALLRLRGRSVP